MPYTPTMHIPRRSLAAAAAVSTALVAASCDRSGGAQQQPGAPQGRPAAVVKMVTLQPKPIQQTSELIATIESLRSMTVQPDAEGVITRIFVKAGDRVRAGAPLVQINAAKQRAAVRSAEASRAGTEADVQYWRQQVKRLESLVEAGAISRQEYEQAQTSLRTAEARLSALEAQVREGRVELEYYRVNAPQAGVVGDVPVRVGDRVTRSTAITTIDRGGAMEASIQVPLDRAAQLRTGLPLQLLDEQGNVIASNPITFVAPRVDDRTQTVQAKSTLRNAPPALRVRQFARARIVWRTAPGLTVPLTAVSRINGKYFCYVAERADKGLVARQRPVELGEVIGNDYVVRSGLEAGERLIVSGIQKIGEGAPVRAE